MRQVVVTRHGSPRVLRMREVDDPIVGQGQVRIRVVAAGVNFADLMARMGLYPDAPPPPCVVGYEVAGVVDEVGEGATNLKPGARVVAATSFGGYSDCVVVPSEAVFALSASLPFETAAALPMNYLTAWMMVVHLGNVREGQTVLIHSAGGGVGLATLQICRWLGARVIGTASAHKHERLMAMGMAHCIDPRHEDFESAVRRLTDGRGVDLALDAVGGASYRKSYSCLAPLGRLFVFGASSLAPGKRRRWIRALAALINTTRFHPVTLMNENRGVVGVHLGRLWNQVPLMRETLQRILTLTTEGTLAPVVDRVFPLGEASAAHAYIHNRKNFGKVLLAP